MKMRYLKYYIRLDLIEFKLTFAPYIPEKIKPIDPLTSDLFERMEYYNALFKIPVKSISLLCTTQFTNIGVENQALKKRREELYYKSYRYFFHLIGKQKIKTNKEGVPDYMSHFHLLTLSNKQFYDQDSVFFVSESKDFPSQKIVVIQPKAKDSITGASTILAANNNKRMANDASMAGQLKMQQMYSFTPSAVTFYTDTFQIDTYGNTNLYPNFIMDGDFGKQLIGYLLPIDYTPDSPELSASNFVTSHKDVLPAAADERIRFFIDRQTMSFPQEKIHVHTDKSKYLAGETVWFRAFLADYNSNTPFVDSHYIYGDLYDPADSLVMRVKIQQDNDGVFKGYLNLLPQLSEGHYRLCFYTRYMEETGEAFFFQ